jgi:hypothetical protein
MAATRTTLDGLLPDVSAAVDAYDASLLDVELERAAAVAGGSDFWGAELETAQALRTLHQLAQLGHLARAGVEDPGESGVVGTRASGGGSLTFSVAVCTDPYLASTRWGRDLWGMQQARLAVTLPFVSSTGYH